ncbi:hypothetical protein MP638_001522 [Amoeboaphelidium occidentale]|nr:hypothetical protein MP638_001522 [Amoeboaphelidium occidentale]
MTILVKTKEGMVEFPAGVTARQVAELCHAVGVRSTGNNTALAGDRILVDGSYLLVQEGMISANSFNSLFSPSSDGSLQVQLVMPSVSFQQVDVSNKLDRLFRVVTSTGSTALGLMHSENILERMQAMEIQMREQALVNSGLQQQIMQQALLNSGLQQRVLELESKDEDRNILERMQAMEIQMREQALVNSGLQQRVLELESKDEDRVKQFNRAKQIVQAALENADAHSPTTEKISCGVCTGAMSASRMKDKTCCSVDICFGCYAFLQPVANEIRCPGCRHVLERVDQ